MARKVENGTQGFSAKNATSKPTNKRKQSQQPAGFGDVADLGDLIPVEGQQQETTPATTKTEEQVIESKQEVVSTENKEQTEETIENKKNPKRIQMAIMVKNLLKYRKNDQKEKQPN